MRDGAGLRYKMTHCRKPLIRLEKTGFLTTPALQEDSYAQALVLTGLIASLTGTALQEDIARAARRFQQLALDILNGEPRHGEKTPAPPRAAARPSRASSAGSITAWCVSAIWIAVRPRRWLCICSWSRWPTPRGLSYYGDASVCARLGLEAAQLDAARQVLLDADLIAYEAPLYQVLFAGSAGDCRAGGDAPGPGAGSACRSVARPEGKPMIDYATYRRVHHLHEVDKLNLTQIAQKLALHPQTVRYWLDEPTFRPRKTPVRPSKLDPYKPLIRQWLEHYPYSGTQIFQRLCEAGFTGGISIVREYVHKVRPQKAPAFLTLHFEPGECAQVDWGHYGSVNVGNTRRQLSFFVLVLCYSRLMYVEFTVSQTMEHFLGCHLNAFEALGGVPARIMVDNLKSAVLQRLSGEAPVFNPRYVDFARHYGFEIAPCNVGAGHEKGRVEAGVGYVKKNLLAGLEIADFSHL